jgi:biotin carboxyl carrier protein
MKRKEYISPQIEVMKMRVNCLTITSGEPIDEVVHTPDEEVDAGDALSRDYFDFEE